MSESSLSSKEREQFLRKIIRLYSKRLAVYALYYLKDPEEAEDTVQEVFMHVWENPGLDRSDPELFKRYLYHAVRNSSLDKIEKRNVRRRYIDRLGEQAVFEDEISFDESTLARVKAEIENLPPRTRKAISCVFLGNMTYRQTAERLRVSVNTVKSLLRTGLKRLRERLDDPTQT